VGQQQACGLIICTAVPALDNRYNVPQQADVWAEHTFHLLQHTFYCSTAA
jgi:hypothetical protein